MCFVLWCAKSVLHAHNVNVVTALLSSLSLTHSLARSLTHSLTHFNNNNSVTVVLTWASHTQKKKFARNTAR